MPNVFVSLLTICLRGSDVKYVNADVASTFLVCARPAGYTSKDALALLLVDKHELGIDVKVCNLKIQVLDRLDLCNVISPLISISGEFRRDVISDVS